MAAGDDPAARLAEMYLEDEHCKDVSGGCALAALTGEVHRRDAKTRRTLRRVIRQRNRPAGGDARRRPSHTARACDREVGRARWHRSRSLAQSTIRS